MTAVRCPGRPTRCSTCGSPASTQPRPTGVERAARRCLHTGRRLAGYHPGSGWIFHTPSHRVICTVMPAGGGAGDHQALDRHRILPIDRAPEEAEHPALSPGSGVYFLLEIVPGVVWN